MASGLAASLRLLAPDSYRDAIQSEGFQQDLSDVAIENMNYEAAALTVSLGLLTPSALGAFEPQRLVSGAEAARAVEELALHVTR